MPDRPLQLNPFDLRVDIDSIRRAIPSSQAPAEVTLEIVPPEEEYPNPQPGFPCRLLMTGEFRDPKDPRNAAPKTGQPGMYKVTIVLQRPGISCMPENQYGSPDVQLGSSCVRVLQPAASDKHAEYGIRFRIPFGADQLECAGHLNTQNIHSSPK